MQALGCTYVTHSLAFLRLRNLIIAITIIMAIVVMEVVATAPPIMTTVLSEDLWGLEEVLLSGIMTLGTSCPYVVGTLGVGGTVGLSMSGVPVTPGCRVRVLVRVTVSPATMHLDKEGGEIRLALWMHVNTEKALEVACKFVRSACRSEQKICCKLRRKSSLPYIQWYSR